MKVVVAGPGKSGTSALGYRIAAALGGCPVLFEPKRRRRYLEPRGDLVVKVIVNRPEQLGRAWAFDDLDRRICLVRDPRDQLISWMLYSWYRHVPSKSDFDGFMELLRRKEQQPSAVDCLALLRHTLQPQRHTRAPDNAARVAEALLARDWLLVRYEDFIADRVDALEDCLGLRMRVDFDVPVRYRRVVRSKGAGGWRHWLTAVDVETLRAGLDPLLAALGYANDWTPADPQVLDPALGSDYVERLRGSPPHRALRALRQLVMGYRGGSPGSADAGAYRDR